jgi:hypothetical protein
MQADDNGSEGLTARLLGRWRLLRADAALEFAPDVCMEFQEGGRLRYEFSVGSHRESVALLYRVEHDMIRTDNPAAPHTTSTRFRFGAGEVLVFDFAGACAWFIREW